MIGGTGFNVGNMPKSITCYICGRGYGTKSIKIHLTACEKKWDIDQQQKPKKERRPCPQAPKNFDQIMNKKKITDKDLLDLNIQAFQEYNEFSLEKCNFCQRTFNPDSFKKHTRICTAEKPMKPLTHKTQQNTQMEKQSIQNLEKQVLQPLQQNQQKNQNSKIEVQKKKVNQTNNVNNLPIKQSQQNQIIEEDQENFQLEQCNQCGRNFAIDRINKHIEICKGNTKPKKVKRFHEVQKDQKKQKQVPKWKQQHEEFQQNMKYNKKLKEAEEKGIKLSDLPPPPKSKNIGFLECPSCSRQFNPIAHERHIKTCANIVNKPKMVTRKNYGKNNRGY